MALGGSIEAARLLVGVGVDGVSQAEKALGGFGGKLSGMGGFLKGAAQQAIGFGGAMLGLQAIGGVTDLIGGSIIGMNAELEKAELQFSSLGMTTEGAKKHIAGLFEFAKRTPFETGPVIAASRMLQVFGRDALNTKENLQLVGDAAAATGAPINDVSFWVGRLYANLQSGKPIGEAMQNLTQLGVVGPDTAKALEAVSEAGGGADEMWKAFTKDLGKFGGAMEKQAGTMEGLTSSLMDTLRMTIATAFRPFFEGAKTLVGGALAFFSDPKVSAGIQAFGAGIVAGLGKVGEILGTVWTIAQPIVTALLDAFGTLAGAFTTVGTAASVTGEGLAGLVQGILTGLGTAVDKVVPILGEMAGKFADWVLAALPGLLKNLGAYMTKMAGWLLEQAPVIATKLLDWGAELVAWIAPRIPELLGMMASFIADLVGWIIREGVPKLAAGAIELGKVLVDRIIGWVMGRNGSKGLLGELADFVTTKLVPGIINFGAELGRAALKLGGELVDGLIRGLGDLGRQLSDAITNELRKLEINLGPFHVNWQGVRIDMPTFASGAWSVPATGPALVHKGEMIVPADLAARLRGEAGRATDMGRLEPARGYGGSTVYVSIGSFYGTEGNIHDLSRELGRVVRLAKV